MKPEYKEGYLEFTDLSTLAERLKGQRMIRFGVPMNNGLRSMRFHKNGMKKAI